jgi:tetratricopeptide (TPR) repeat protein
LNEEQNVDDWYKSCQDADYILVGDTGSVDNTVKKFKDLNIPVYPISIKPFRFDIARNTVLAMVPNDIDICVCLDLDERLEDGWRKKIEDVWTPTTTKLQYTSYYNFAQNPNLVTKLDRIHKRYNYVWKRAVHECIMPIGIDEVITQSDLNIYQFQDTSKFRNYLPMMKMTCEEYPDDQNFLHWYGRELRSRNDKSCVEIFKKYLSHPNATWKEERADAMRSIGLFENQEYWLKLAVEESKLYRKPYVELALIYYSRLDWSKCLTQCLHAINLPKTNTYLDDQNDFGPILDDLASISYWNLNMKEKSLEHAQKAFDLSPNDERLKNNLIAIKNSIN